MASHFEMAMAEFPEGDTYRLQCPKLAWKLNCERGIDDRGNGGLFVGPRNTPYKVLIVDDEPIFRDAIGKEFRKRGWETFQAEGGYPAFERFQSQPADLIVTDVRMPNGTGLHLLEALRADESQRPVIILISGHAEVDEYRALQLGADGFFLKPISLKDFMPSVLSIFEAQIRQSA